MNRMPMVKNRPIAKTQADQVGNLVIGLHRGLARRLPRSFSRAAPLPMLLFGLGIELRILELAAAASAWACFGPGQGRLGGLLGLL
jgi:hypothetical protein